MEYTKLINITVNNIKCRIPTGKHNLTAKDIVCLAGLVYKNPENYRVVQYFYNDPRHRYRGLTDREPFEGIEDGDSFEVQKLDKPMFHEDWHKPYKAERELVKGPFYVNPNY